MARGVLLFVAALFAVASAWLLWVQGHGPSIQLGLLAGAIAFVTWAAGYLLPSGQDLIQLKASPRLARA